MNDLAIHVENAGKRFVKYEDTPMLVSRLSRLYSRTTRSSLWAVRNANLEIGQGEIVGIVGRNGSGKSTLLRMLAGVTAPTEGRVSVRGRIAPLIAVGVGFHPELTGRENVYISGTVLGLSRRQIDDRFDELVEFAEVSQFIDTPVKFYSSGMFVRLGFAVSVMSDPDVLIVDEVLAVGDIAFQLKCIDRMAEVQKSGATIVVVSHNMAAIRSLCPRTVVLHRGAVRHDGDTETAISMYHRLLAEDRDLDERSDRPGPLPAERELDLRAHVEQFELLDARGETTRHVDSQEEVEFVVEARFVSPTDGPVLALSITNSAGVHVYGETVGWRRHATYRPGDVYRASIRVRLSLASGTYNCSVGLASQDGVVIAPRLSPLLVYVGGRAGVNGIADLDARFLVADEVQDKAGSDQR